MSEQFIAALAAADAISDYFPHADFLGPPRAELETIRAVLKAALQEAEARKAIAQWCEHKLRECRYGRSGWHHLTLGVPGEVGGIVFQGPDFAKVTIDAGKWCLTEFFAK